MKIDFLVAGVQKAGTTSLDAWLRQHSDIGMARRKEVHFFDNEEVFAQGTPDDALYHADWDADAHVLIRGEVTPITTYWADAPRRIWHYNPHMRLIVLLRNPIERAWSHWKMACKLGEEDLPFAEAIRRETERCRVALPFQHRMLSYIDRGFYSEQIRRLRRFFPNEQLLFIKSEGFRCDPQAGLTRICQFLAVPDMAFDVRQRLNASPDIGDIPPTDRRYLREVLAPDIRQTEALLGWQCPDWYE